MFDQVFGFRCNDIRAENANKFIIGIAEHFGRALIGFDANTIFRNKNRFKSCIAQRPIPFITFPQGVFGPPTLLDFLFQGLPGCDIVRLGSFYVIDCLHLNNSCHKVIFTIDRCDQGLEVYRLSRAGLQVALMLQAGALARVESIRRAAGFTDLLVTAKYFIAFF